MPKIASIFEQPKGKAARELVDSINSTKVKPRLTFVFPLSGERRKAIELLAKEEPALDEIKPLFSSTDEPVLAAALHSLSKLKAKGKLEGKLDYVLEDLPERLRNRVKRRLSAHAKLSKTSDTAANFTELEDKTMKALGLTPIKNMHLLGSRKAVFATPHTEAIAAKIKSLQKISDALAKEFPEHFVGLTVVGSIPKGYANSSSDADLFYLHTGKTYAIEDEIQDRLRRNATQEGIEIQAFPLDLNGPSVHNALFQGLFFGDREKLFDAQKKAVATATPEQWEKLVSNAKGTEGDYTKVLERHSVSPDKLISLIYATHLLRVPPDLKQMRQIMAEKELSMWQGRQTK